MPHLRTLLASHPRCSLEAGEPSRGVLEFSSGQERRAILIEGDHAVYGLPEIMDNNPLVCAQAVRVPGPESTLALIALAPLIRAGILAETPGIISCSPVNEEIEADIDEALETAGWEEGARLACDLRDTGDVLALSALALVNVPDSQLTEVDDIYEEAYGRSFFVHRQETEDWDTSLVAGTNQAVFRLRVTPGEAQSLLRVQVLADRNGKAGAAQIIHVMNIMAGFEESLGLG